MRRPNKTRIRNKKQYKKRTRHNQKYKKYTRHNKRYNNRTRKQKGGENLVVFATRAANALTPVGVFFGIANPIFPVTVGAMLVIYTMYKLRQYSNELAELLPIALDIITNFNKLNALITKTDNIFIFYLFNNEKFESYLTNSNNNIDIEKEITNGVDAYKTKVSKYTQGGTLSLDNVQKNGLLVEDAVLDKNIPDNIPDTNLYKTLHFSLLGHVSKDVTVYNHIIDRLSIIIKELLYLLPNEQIVELAKNTKSPTNVYNIDNLNNQSEFHKTVMNEFKKRNLQTIQIRVGKGGETKSGQDIVTNDDYEIYMLKTTPEPAKTEAENPEDKPSKDNPSMLSKITNVFTGKKSSKETSVETSPDTSTGQSQKENPSRISKLTATATATASALSRVTNTSGRFFNRAFNAKHYVNNVVKNLTILNSYYTILKSQYDLTMEHYSLHLKKTEYDKIRLLIELQPEYIEFLVPKDQILYITDQLKANKDLIQKVVLTHIPDDLNENGDDT